MFATSKYAPFTTLSIATGYFCKSEFRYSFRFNGKENDKEGMGGGGSTYDYGFRIYNAQLGKFLSVDPLTASYPWYTPYQFSGNKPIFAIDLDGLEEFVIVAYQYTTKRGRTVVYRVEFEYIKPEDRADGAKSEGTALRIRGLTTRNLNLNPTLFNKQALNRQFLVQNNSVEFDLEAAYDDDYILAKKYHKSGKSGGYNFPGVILPLKDDEGTKKDEIQKNFEYSNERLDEFDVIAARLVFDNESKVNVLGSATPSATNINRTEGSLSIDNNKKLAELRAQAGKEFLLDYIKKTYGVEVDPNRIQTSSFVGRDPNKTSDRNVSFSVSPTQF
jgi:RHS repeat-associated protein